MITDTYRFDIDIQDLEQTKNIKQTLTETEKFDVRVCVFWLLLSHMPLIIFAIFLKFLNFSRSQLALFVNKQMANSALFGPNQTL